MFSKANIVSTILTAIWGLGGGFLLWGIIAEPLMADHMTLSGLIKEEPDMVWLAIGCIIQAFAFCTIYSKWGASGYSAMSGLTFGLWMGLMVGLGEGLIDFATSNMMDMTGTLMGFAVYLVFFGITGLIAGLVYSKMGSAS